MELTTNLEILRRTPGKFTWGKIEKFHDIDRYTIVEYSRELLDGNHMTMFHVYVAGEDTYSGAENIERAMILAIARGNLDPNRARWMADAACRLLQVKEFE